MQQSQLKPEFNSKEEVKESEISNPVQYMRTLSMQIQGRNGFISEAVVVALEKEDFSCLKRLIDLGFLAVSHQNEVLNALQMAFKTKDIKVFKRMFDIFVEENAYILKSED